MLITTTPLLLHYIFIQDNVSHMKHTSDQIPPPPPTNSPSTGNILNDMRKCISIHFKDDYSKSGMFGLLSSASELHLHILNAAYISAYV